MLGSPNDLTIPCWNVPDFFIFSALLGHGIVNTRKINGIPSSIHDSMIPKWYPSLPPSLSPWGSKLAHNHPVHSGESEVPRQQWRQRQWDVHDLLEIWRDSPWWDSALRPSRTHGICLTMVYARNFPNNSSHLGHILRRTYNSLHVYMQIINTYARTSW